ncbi:uncharacterized protein LOC135703642 isoform X2 [Ochlerotatus camptorhynchus]
MQSMQPPPQIIAMVPGASQPSGSTCLWNVHHPVVVQSLEKLPDTVAVVPGMTHKSDVSLQDQDTTTSSSLTKVDSESDHLDTVSSLNSDPKDVFFQEPVSDTNDNVLTQNENQSPNKSQKRQPSTATADLKITKSSKRHATTDMKFRAFDINWQKVSDSILLRLKKLQDFRDKNPTGTVPREKQFPKSELTALANAIVDQLRVINVHITASTMEEVAKQVLSKYPCLNFVDDDGFGTGQSFVVLKHKMINRNTYLNRYKDSDSRSSAAETKRNRNVKAGTIKEYWEVSAEQCSKDILSKLTRDETGVLTVEFLTASQAYIRFYLDQPESLKELLARLPVLRRRQLISFHFEKATGVQLNSLEKMFLAKRAKIIDFSGSSRPALVMDKHATDYDILKFLCSSLGENIVHLIIQKEIGTKVADLTTDCAGPVLVAVDLGNDKHVYYVMVEQVRLTEGTQNVVTAIADLLSVHYVYNFMYMKQISKFLEFVQEYFCKILPVSGSKSRATRKSQQQRMVKRLIEGISSHTATASLARQIN